MMLGRRVEVLKEKLKGLEKEHQQRLTAGGKERRGRGMMGRGEHCFFHFVVQHWTSRRRVWISWPRGDWSGASETRRGRCNRSSAIR